MLYPLAQCIVAIITVFQHVVSIRIVEGVVRGSHTPENKTGSVAPGFKNSAGVKNMGATPGVK
jgi:hypothetical protein